MVSEYGRGLEECKQAVRISDQPQAGLAGSQWVVGQACSSSGLVLVRRWRSFWRSHGSLLEEEGEWAVGFCRAGMAETVGGF